MTQGEFNWLIVALLIFILMCVNENGFVKGALLFCGLQALKAFWNEEGEDE